MKRLTLMRHAQADDPVTDQQDWERPLTRRGLADAELMAKRLKANKWHPDLMLVSCALRTRQTAEVICRCFTKLHSTIVDDLYLADPKQLMHLIHQHGGDAAHVLVVAHNPGICEFADALSAERRIEAMPTAAWMSAEYDLIRWDELLPASGVNVEFDYPRRG